MAPLAALKRILHDPTAGAVAILVAAVVSLGIVVLTRRLVPRDGRARGSVTATLLILGFLLGVVRLVVAVTGAGQSMAGRVVGTLGLFFVALGGMSAVVLLIFEVLPARTRVRLPSITR